MRFVVVFALSALRDDSELSAERHIWDQIRENVGFRVVLVFDLEKIRITQKIAICFRTQKRRKSVFTDVSVCLYGYSVLRSVRVDANFDSHAISGSPLLGRHK